MNSPVCANGDNDKFFYARGHDQNCGCLRAYVDIGKGSCRDANGKRPTSHYKEGVKLQLCKDTCSKLVGCISYQLTPPTMSAEFCYIFGMLTGTEIDLLEGWYAHQGESGAFNAINTVSSSNNHISCYVKATVCSHIHTRVRIL